MNPKLIEIQIAPLGRWYYKGQPFDVTDAHVAAAVEYFDTVRKPNGQQTVIDYEHASTTGGEAPASGWIHELRAKAGKGLYALVEWTKRAKGYIDAKEYRWLSPVLAFNVRNEKTGEPVMMKLLSAALTNNPFLPEIEEVRAKLALETDTVLIARHTDLTNIFTGAISMDLQEIVDQLKQLLGLGADAAANDILAKVKTIVQAAEALGGSSPEENMQEAQAAMSAMTELGKVLVVEPKKDTLIASARSAAEAVALRGDLVKLLGTSDDRSVIMARIAELKGGADPDKYVPLSKFQELEQRLATRDAEDFLRTNAKRIPPADKETYREFFLKDPEMTRAMVAKLPELSTDEITPSKNEPTTFALTAEEKHLCKVLGRDEKEFLERKKQQAA